MSGKKNIKVLVIVAIIGLMLLGAGIVGGKYFLAWHKQNQVKTAANLYMTDILGGRSLLAHENITDASKEVVTDKQFSDIYANMHNEKAQFEIRNIRVDGEYANVLGMVSGTTKKGVNVKMLATMTLIKDKDWRVDGTIISGPAN